MKRRDKMFCSVRAMGKKPTKTTPARKPVEALINARFGSITRFASEIGTSQQRVSQFLSGKTDSPGNLHMYVEKLDVDAKWLLNTDPYRATPAPKNPANINAGLTSGRDTSFAGKSLRKDSPEMDDLKLRLATQIGSLDPDQLSLVDQFLRTLRQAVTKDLDRPRKPGKTG